MPVSPTYPGVYIEEIPSGVRTIVGVATSITAFIGRALRGPTNEPIRVQNFGDYERSFGGLWTQSTMSYAVQQYFLNGGSDALIVRVHRNAQKATLSLPGGSGPLVLEAASEGAWGNGLRAQVDHRTRDADSATPDPDLFNVVIEELDPTGNQVTAAEPYLNLSRASDSPRYVVKVLEQESSLVRVQGAVPPARPDEGSTTATATGSDGDPIESAQIASDPGLEAAREGIWALDKADLFNLLCIPPLTRDTDYDYTATLAPALAYCKQRRVILIVDPPISWNDPQDVQSSGIGVDTLGLRGDNAKNAAIYFPRLRIPDPLQENRLADFVPCGVVAGIFARTDAQRGVWKAPAGLEASLVGVRELTYKLTDGQQGQLNPLGVNCFRTFPVIGHVVWGARTIDGADRLSSEWKYLPVRRTALFIEETLYRNTQWVVFEPNDEPLWAQIRLNIGAFMQTLFRQGAFQGKTPRDAYFVKCDGETTTQNDIDRGIVNILVGFAPLKPAEFVMIKIQQKARQPET